MRFLKTKILKAQEALEKRLSASPNPPSQTKSEDIIPESPEDATQKVDPTNDKCSPRQERGLNLSKNGLKGEEVSNASLKNIAVNYARAIACFAISNLAVPYLEKRLENEDLTLEEFVDFMNKEKNKMGGITSFRARLLVDDTDEPKVATCKRVFQWIAEVFIKYFSVNWITHGRLFHKEIYMKFRFKMLRRVQNPESFTYIREKKTGK